MPHFSDNAYASGYKVNGSDICTSWLKELTRSHLVMNCKSRDQRSVPRPNFPELELFHNSLFLMDEVIILMDSG